MSRETTFERDLHAVRDRPSWAPSSPTCACKLAGDLQRKGYVGKTIGIKLRYDDFRIATRDQTIEHFTADGKTIRQVAGQCLKRVTWDSGCGCSACGWASWRRPTRRRSRSVSPSREPGTLDLF